MNELWLVWRVLDAWDGWLHIIFDNEHDANEFVTEHADKRWTITKEIVGKPTAQATPL